MRCERNAVIVVRVDVENHEKRDEGLIGRVRQTRTISLPTRNLITFLVFLSFTKLTLGPPRQKFFARGSNIIAFARSFGCVLASRKDECQAS